jgi:large conductance mechanosensitive channel
MFKNITNEFITFIKRGNVIDLAVAVIMGAAFNPIIQSLVNDIIMPPIGWLLGGVDFTNLFITLSGGSYDTLAAAQEAGAVTINYGIFLNNIITFLVTSIAVFALVKLMNSLDRKKAAEPAPPPAPPAPSAEEKLLTEIRDLLAKK